MKPVKTLSAALVMSALLVALTGCEKQEGPMEKAGQEYRQRDRVGWRTCRKCR